MQLRFVLLQSKKQVSEILVVRHMKRLLLWAVVVAFSTVAWAADEPKESKAVDRAQGAGEVLNEIQSAPDSGIPQNILSRAECVAGGPSMRGGGCRSIDAEGWFRFWGEVWARARELPDPEGMECAGILRGGGRQLRIPDRGAGRRLGDAHHE